MGLFDSLFGADKVAKKYELMGEYFKSAQIYEQLKEYMNAAKVYEKGKYYDQAGRMYEKMLLYPQAEKIYEKGKEYILAGKLNEKLSNFEKAAHYFEQANEPILAGAMFEKIGDYKKAAEMYSIPQALFIWQHNVGSTATCVIITDDNKILVGSRAGGLTILNLRGELIKYSETPFRSLIEDASNDGKFFIARRKNKLIYCDIYAKELWKFTAKGEINTCKMSSYGDYVILGTVNGYVNMLNNKGHYLWGYRQTQYDKVVGIATTHTGHKSIIGFDTEVILLNGEGELLKTIGASGSAFTCVTISDDGKWILIGKANGTIELRNIEDEGINRYYDIKGYSISVVKITPDNKYFCVGTENGFIGQWKLDGDLLCSTNLERTVTDADFDKEGKYIISGQWNGDVNLIRISDMSSKAGDMYAKLGQYQKAGRIYQKAGLIDEALSCFEKAGVQEHIGILYEEKEDYLKAAEIYVEDNNLIKAAEMYEKIGKHLLAAELYLKAELGNKAAILYEQDGQIEAALKAYQNYLDKHPDASEIYLHLGELYLKQEDYDNAIKNLQKASNIPEFQKEALYLLGDCFQYKNLISASRECYEKILTLDYSYKDVQEKLNILSTSKREKTIPKEIGELETIYTEEPSESDFPERYKILEKLGQGGMGVVYKALDEKLGRIIAIKSLPKYEYSQKEQERFLREARATAMLSNPHIVHIYDIDEIKNFIVMEYIEGGTLRDLLQKEIKLPFKRTRKILKQVINALNAAHKAGIVHRDIKPGNILLKENENVRLTDFGIAHITGATMTQAGAQLGTLLYMSPEQIIGKEVDVRTDIYALGIMAYEMLVGEPPFKRGDISYQHIHTQPIPPSKVNIELSEILDKVILKCLMKNKEDRYIDVISFGEALEQIPISDTDETGISAEAINIYKAFLMMALADGILSPEEQKLLNNKQKELNITSEMANKLEEEIRKELSGK